MPLTLSEQMQLCVDASIQLRRRNDAALPCAVVDRELVELLMAIRDTGSVLEACKKLSMSARTGQRLVKRFVDRSGIEILQSKGCQGTELTDEGRQCIELYVASQYCVRQVVKEHMQPRALPPLDRFPNEHDWSHRAL